MFLKRLSLLKSLLKHTFLLGTLMLISCQGADTLPIYGERDFNVSGDTVFHSIPDFEFVNQFNEQINQDLYKGKIYIADFFFTTCPGICPIMTGELSRVQGELKGLEEDVLILSHTVDPESDSTAVLLAYGKKKGADFSTWNFVTGTKSKLYRMAESYLVVANHNPGEDMEFVHSDKLVLIDKKGKVRGLYSGIETKEVDQLIRDTKTLITEYE
ncbi:MAG: protein SCO1/2 [Saprospiraceae bacterium]|jgi:protein SCO1/2